MAHTLAGQERVECKEADRRPTRALKDSGAHRAAKSQSLDLSRSKIRTLPGTRPRVGIFRTSRIAREHERRRCFRTTSSCNRHPLRTSATVSTGPSALLVAGTSVCRINLTPRRPRPRPGLPPRTGKPPDARRQARRTPAAQARSAPALAQGRGHGGRRAPRRVLFPAPLGPTSGTDGARQGSHPGPRG